MASSSSFEMLCIVLLGLGQMCIMTGYDTQSFVAESVLHSVSRREPERIDPHAGYYGQATCFGFYMLTCIFAPWILSIVPSKWTLFLGSICYTLYQVGFLYLNNYYYYTSCAIMGVGFALFYAGHGAYLMSHSTRKTIEQNSAIAWSTGCLCMIIGSGILAAIFSLNKNLPEILPMLNTTSEPSRHAYRQFTDMEIRMMYGAFTAVTLCANLIFALAPSREIPDCIEGKHNKSKTTFRHEMEQVLAGFIDKRMIALTPLCLHLGFFGAFWICVYSTTLTFTKSLSNHIYLPALYSLAAGLGEVTMGVVISVLSRYIRDFGLKPTMYCGFILNSTVLLAVLASVPKWATVGLTDEPAWIIQPNIILSVCLGFMIGLVDSCMNNVRNVICALALPDRRAQAFAISKFYQAAGGTVLMFISPYLSVYHYCSLLFLSLTLATCCFVYEAGKTEKMEKEVYKEISRSRKCFHREKILKS